MSRISRWYFPGEPFDASIIAHNHLFGVTGKFALFFIRRVRTMQEVFMYTIHGGEYL